MMQARIGNPKRMWEAMAYPGDFVAANRTARIDAQHAGAYHFLHKKRRVSGLRRAGFRVWEGVTKRIHSRGPH
jgi:hypothetical protein